MRVSSVFRSYLAAFGFLLAPSCVSWEVPDVDGDGVLVADGDCNDLNPDSYPDAPEVWYDGEDQNCDGNDGDQDGDGWLDQDYEYGDKYPSEFGEGDCDDGEFDVNPDAAEIWYDGVDGDCDGESDFDQDGDGEDSLADPDLDSNVGLDCDDTDAEINTSAAEIWYDGVDQDCDDWSDYDQDGDGFDSESEAGGLDCVDGADGDDSNATELDEAGLAASDVNPDATEVWYDGIDQDCDGESDYDQDGDGYDSSIEIDGGVDCDDFDAGIGGESEIWYNGIDENCDYNDGDQDFDGYVDVDYNGSFVSTDLDGTPLPVTDCNDEDAAIHPDHSEDCSTSYDDNCDDDAVYTIGNTSGGETFYVDNDNDTWGVNNTITACSSGGDSWYYSATGDTYRVTASLFGGNTDDCDDDDAWLNWNDDDSDSLHTCDTDLDDSNGLPSISGVSITPSSPEVTDTLNCATVGWDDGDASPNGDTDQSTFIWEKGGTSVGTGSTLALSSFAYGDTLSCTGTPYDGTQDGISTSASVTIQNSVPTVSITSPTSGDLTDEGDDVSFGAVVSDSDQSFDSLSIDWSSSIDGSFSSDGANSSGVAAFTEGALAAGTHILTVTVTDDAGATATDTVSFIVNGLPSQPNVSISPATAYVDDDLVATAIGSSDAEGDTITYSYVWTVGGVTSSTISSTLPQSETTAGETWEVVVTPTDPDGGVGPTDSAQVTISNSDPVISGPTITPSSGVTTSSSLTCSATATDIDGDSPTISYEWTNGSSTLGTGANLTLTTATASPSDSITCTATATDAVGGTDSSASSVSVDNTAPVVTSVTVSPSSGVIVTSTLTCAATATDADGGSPTITYSWTNGSSTIGAGSSLTLNNSTALPSDSVTCTATATDADGDTDSDTSSVSVDNSDPTFSVAAAITPSSGVSTSSALVCSAAATDIDGGTPAITYAWSNGTSSIGSGSSLTLTSSTSSPSDSITCTATATDSDGGSVVSVDIVTVNNTDPVVASVSISPSTGVTTSSTLTCSASSTDADGGTPTIGYVWTNGSSTLGTSPSLTLTASTASPSDTITCSATATDSDGGTDSSTTSVTVDNTAPVVTSVAVSPSSGVTVSSTLTCAASATDPDGGSPTLTYIWTNGSSTIGTGSSVTLSTSTASKTDSITCTATATDSDGDSGSDTSSVTVENTAPSITGPTVTPSTGVTTSSTLTCTATATDADGETPAISFVWTNGSSTLGTDASLTLSSSTASPSDTIACAATATDGSGATDSGSSSVSVDNTDPVIASVAISPSSGVTVTSALTCSASSTDADGGSPTVTYAWTNGSTALGTGSSLTLSASAATSGDTITCTATATDVHGGTATGTDTASVTNSAPVIASVILTPPIATEISTLTCAPVGTTDADGDSVSYTYAWNISGIASSQSSSTLSGTYFNRDDTVYCVVSPNDGSSTGSAVNSNTLTILNTAPSVSSVSITPATALDSDTLTCSYSFSDVDSDTDASTIAWTVGSATIGTGSTVSTGFVAGDTVQCTVTPNDGTDTGAELSTTTLIGSSNTAPVMTTVTLSPSSVYTDDTISTSVSATDADGDSVTYTYEWYVDSAVVAETSSTIDCSTYCDKGESVYVSVTPNDGTDSGAALTSSAITILNSIPTDPVISIDPVIPEAGIDDVICIIDTASTDADGDTVTYSISWEEDSVAWAGSTYTTYEADDTLDGADITADLQYECTVSASDGADSSSDVTATVTSTIPSTITHPGGGEMLLLSAGTFDMGCTTAQVSTGSCSSDESPAHTVTLTHDFYMGETEVTQGEYVAIIGSNPSYWASAGQCNTSDCPVEYLYWHEAAEYANALSVLDGLTECFTCTSGSCTTTNSPYTCDGYRLPTEAEWEYAARAGTDYLYAGSDTVGDVAWYNLNSTYSQPVAQKDPNDWGLYDMTGNVSEFNWDWSDSSYYSTSPASDPEGAATSTDRVVRGGAWKRNSSWVRVSNRYGATPIYVDSSIGLRLVRSIP